MGQIEKIKKLKKSTIIYLITIVVLFAISLGFIIAFAVERNKTCVCSVHLFKHPGVLVSKAQLDFVKGKYASADPWLSAYNLMSGNGYASLSFEAKPREVVECGSYSNPNHGCSDERDSAIAAYTHALSWYYTGNKAYATKAIEIMDAWSATLTGHNNSNAPLQSGWTGAVWPRAGEIIKHSEAGWANDKVERFGHMLKTVYLPVVSKGSPNNGNWEAVMIEATGAIAVFLDDEESFQHAIYMWKKRVPAYMYLKKDGDYPVAPPQGNINTPAQIIEFWNNQTTFVDGLAQETCRDFGHTSWGIAASINLAETAYHQGIDIYKEEQDRIFAAMEFHAKYYNGEIAPSWLCGGKIDISTFYPFWEIGYNHFHNRMKVEMPNTLQLINKYRPMGTDPMDKAHFLAWETLTHAENTSE